MIEAIVLMVAVCAAFLGGLEVGLRAMTPIIVHAPDENGESTKIVLVEAPK